MNFNVKQLLVSVALVYPIVGGGSAFGMRPIATSRNLLAVGKAALDEKNTDEKNTGVECDEKSVKVKDKQRVKKVCYRCALCPREINLIGDVDLIDEMVVAPKCEHKFHKNCFLDKVTYSNGELVEGSICPVCEAMGASQAVKLDKFYHEYKIYHCETDDIYYADRARFFVPRDAAMGIVGLHAHEIIKAIKSAIRTGMGYDSIAFLIQRAKKELSPDIFERVKNDVMVEVWPLQQQISWKMKTLSLDIFKEFEKKQTE